MKQIRLSLILALFFLGALPQTGQAKIIVGLSSVNVAFLPVYVTEDRGFFKAEGLDVLLVLFNAGATNLQALIGGDVQIMGSAFVETIGGRAAGVDIKNFWGVCNIMPFQLYSQPDFKSMKQAKGKRFAISRFGSLTDFLTRATLRHFGLDAKDVTILQIGSTPARFAALTAKGVDASIVWFPVTEIAKAQGYNKLLDLKEVFPEWPYETFAAKESWLSKERDQANRFLRAFQRGVKYTQENKNDAVRILRKYVKMDPAYAPAGYDEYRDSFPLNGQIAEKVIPVVIEQEIEAGRIKKKITVEDMIDRSFIKAAGR
ncbi:MAG: ABC transporter substrate-binding protein [Deltaproteobacteria bacterium]|nr:ABC transporter substrate-binding protein [Deltaproteobacteria bacterium]MBI2181818.1 ABC transporter substrate-binding protein [Deltaproteobacteria bacterium]MBI2367026.1 ABC transporter substrate-binding protein [Deltaproteobacteria bacterium]MBI2530720.1 ABC transporter substrate-binding protein [Deltaproteobacteria bacterium]MBI3065114.1 ABC transporter substrate-binding protein [Deltaproteobacteria bacterium]